MRRHILAICELSLSTGTDFARNSPATRALTHTGEALQTLLTRSYNAWFPVMLQSWIKTLPAHCCLFSVGTH